MVRFTTSILKFGSQGEKTGWFYILIPAEVAGKLKPGHKRSFRVKGKLDEHPISKMALLPMGEGDFILVLKAAIRKALGKRNGASLKVQLEVDNTEIKPPKELMECLADEPEALNFFKTLTKSHQNYFGNWVRDAKTEETRAKRIAQIINAMTRSMGFPEMIRALKQQREDLRDLPG